MLGNGNLQEALTAIGVHPVEAQYVSRHIESDGVIRGDGGPDVEDAVIQFKTVIFEPHSMNEIVHTTSGVSVEKTPLGTTYTLMPES